MDGDGSQAMRPRPPGGIDVKFGRASRTEGVGGVSDGALLATFRLPRLWCNRGYVAIVEAWFRLP